MMKLLNVLCASAVIAAGATQMAHGAAKWDMPVAYSAGNFQTKNDMQFAQCVNQGASSGPNVVVHPAGSLFAGNDIMRAVQTGQAPIGERLISAEANQNPLFGVDSVPFLATSFKASQQLWKAARPAIRDALKQDNLVYLYAVPWPPQGLYTDKAVADVGDLKGVKFRAYNPATARLARLAGMVPVQIEAADLSQALATGVVESFMSSGATGYDQQVWQQLSHFYDVRAWLPRNVVFVNQSAWNGLDAATRKVIKSCAKQASARGLTRSKKLTKFYLKKLVGHGMKVQKPSKKLAKQFKQIGHTMTKDWLDKAGAEGKRVIKTYKGMQQQSQ